jgi:hypothetical protein
MELKTVRLSLATAAAAVILASVLIVASNNGDSLDMARGTGLSPTATNYVQPTIPTAHFGSTVTETPLSVDGSTPTTLETTKALIDPDHAAKGPATCRHWDICLQVTPGLAPPDHQ